MLPPHAYALQQKQRSFLTFGFGAGGSGPSRRESKVNVNVTPTSHDASSDTPEIRKYKKRFNSEILCAALWGVNLLIGTENGLMLLDRSGQGKVIFTVQSVTTINFFIKLLYFCSISSLRFINWSQDVVSSKWKSWRVKTFWSQYPARRTASAFTTCHGWNRKFYGRMVCRM